MSRSFWATRSQRNLLVRGRAFIYNAIVKPKQRRWLLALAFGVIAVWLYREARRAWLERHQDELILTVATRYGVDPALVKAVIWRESRFDPGARGTSGEIGLMQIMKDTGDDWAKAENIRFYWHRQLFDPEKNIRAGTWYLKRMLRRYQHTDNPIPYALAAYNAGPGNADKWAKGAASASSAAFIRQIGFPGTRQYVQAVMRRHDYYRRQSPLPGQKK
jgi:soluble lytic murein transglycosylase